MCRWVFSPPAAGTEPGLVMSGSSDGRSDTVVVLEPPLYQCSATSEIDGWACARLSTQPRAALQKRAGFSTLSLLTTLAVLLPFQ
jgi:hypothetical protein